MMQPSVLIEGVSGSRLIHIYIFYLYSVNADAILLDKMPQTQSIPL